VVKGATLKRNWEVFGIEDGFDGLLYDRKFRPLTLKDVRGILPLGGTILGTTNRGNPFAYPVKKGGKILLMDISDKIVEKVQKRGIDALIVVGGDGSLKIALELMQKGIPVVGIPKTIDNDLMETDVTFGFNTAVQTATDALDKLHTTAESHHRVMILEVMGRDAGWIALESGIAGGADVILVPEIPFKIEKVCAAIEERRKKGSRFSIIVAAEGAFPAGGKKIIKKTATETLGLESLGGVGDYVAREITVFMKLDIRVTVLGHLQRGGSPSTFDRFLGSRFGIKALQLIEKEEFGRMVCLKGVDIKSVPIEKAVRKLKLVDPNGEMVEAAEEFGICLGR
jgi:6-phosphofructokinase 1